MLCGVDLLSVYLPSASPRIPFDPVCSPILFFSFNFIYPLIREHMHMSGMGGTEERDKQTLLIAEADVGLNPKKPLLFYTLMTNFFV